MILVDQTSLGETLDKGVKHQYLQSIVLYIIILLANHQIIYSVIGKAAATAIG